MDSGDYGWLGKGEGWASGTAPAGGEAMLAKAAELLGVGKADFVLSQAKTDMPALVAKAFDGIRLDVEQTRTNLIQAMAAASEQK